MSIWRHTYTLPEGRTIYVPDGVVHAVRDLPAAALIPLILISPLLFGDPIGSARIPLAIVAAAMLLLRAARQVNVHVEVGPDYVRVANVYRTRTLAWSQVKLIRVRSEILDDFESTTLEGVAEEYDLPVSRLVQGEGGEVLFIHGLALELVDGTRVPVKCVSADALHALTLGLREQAQRESQRQRRQR